MLAPYGVDFIDCEDKHDVRVCKQCEVFWFIYITASKLQVLKVNCEKRLPTCEFAPHMQTNQLPDNGEPPPPHHALYRKCHDPQ